MEATSRPQAREAAEENIEEAECSTLGEAARGENTGRPGEAKKYLQDVGQGDNYCPRRILINNTVKLML